MTLGAPSTQLAFKLVAVINEHVPLSPAFPAECDQHYGNFIACISTHSLSPLSRLSSEGFGVVEAVLASWWLGRCAVADIPGVWPALVGTGFVSSQTGM